MKQYNFNKPRFDISTLSGKIAVMKEYESGNKDIFTKSKHSTIPWYPSNPDFNWYDRKYNYFEERQKILIPWTVETAPKTPIILIKRKGLNETYVLWNSKDKYIESCCRDYYSLLEKWEYTPDNGVTWLPCGTEVYE